MADAQDGTDTRNSSSVNAMLASLLLNIIIFSVFVLIFCMVRVKNSRVYSPRALDVNAKNAPKELPKSMFGWIKPLFKYTDEELIKYVGPDGFVLLYTFKQNAYLFLAVSVVALAVLLPVNVTANGDATGLDKISMGNVPRGSNLLWVHIVAAVLFSMGNIYINFQAIKKAAGLRQCLLIKYEKQKNIKAYTVLVSGISTGKNTREGIQEMLDDESGEVRAVYPVKDLGDLNEAIEDRDKWREVLEKTLTEAARKEKKNEILESKGKKKQEIKRRKVKVGFMGVVGEKVDAIEYGAAEVKTINKEIEELQNKVEESPNTTSAFLLFNDMESAHKYTRTRMSDIKTQVNVMRKKRYSDIDPREVVWKNLGVSMAEKKGMRVVSICVCVAIILLWSIPTAFFSGLANLKNLQNLAGFKWISKLPKVVLSILEGVIPAVALLVLSMLVPIIMRIFIGFERDVVKGKIEKKLMDRFFFYTVFNLFVIYLISGSVLASLNDFIENPGKVLDTITQNIPKNSVFFMTFVVLTGLSSSSGSILQLPRLIVGYLKDKVFERTPRDEVEAGKAPVLEFGTVIPMYSYVFMLGAVFSVMTPLMPVFATVYFILNYIALKYNLIYVYQSSTMDFGGKMAKKLINQRWIGLYVMQVTILFVLALNSKTENPISSILRIVVMAGCIAATAIANIWMQLLYYPRLEYLEAVCPSLANLRKYKLFPSFIAESRYARLSYDDCNIVDQYFVQDDSETLGDDKLLSELFSDPAYSDPAHSLVWAPQISKFAQTHSYEQSHAATEFTDIPSTPHYDAYSVYRQTSELLGDRGTLVVDGATINSKLKTRVTVTSVPTL